MLLLLNFYLTLEPCPQPRSGAVGSGKNGKEGLSGGEPLSLYFPIPTPAPKTRQPQPLPRHFDPQGRVLLVLFGPLLSPRCPGGGEGHWLSPPGAPTGVLEPAARGPPLIW